MTKNPAFESATAVLLDYVEDTEMFANAMNESTAVPHCSMGNATSCANRPQMSSGS